jgi:hypothetical protein
MNLDQAMSAIEQYSIDNGVDSLSGIEQMVKNYKILTPRQQEAVAVFMDKTKEVA